MSYFDYDVVRVRLYSCLYIVDLDLQSLDLESA